MSYLNSQSPEMLTINELTERSMDESRRKEIEGIIGRLKVIESELRQIQLADALSKTPEDQAWEVRITADRIRTDIKGLKASIE